MHLFPIPVTWEFGAGFFLDHQRSQPDRTYKVHEVILGVVFLEILLHIFLIKSNSQNKNNALGIATYFP